jgi:putative PIN family toxin of toxin-antitoxin system
MRAVIDTNVLVSGIINPHGSPGRVVDSIVSQTITVLYDDRILLEYRDVLLRPFFGFQASDVNVLVDFIEFSGEQTTAGPVDIVLPDPTDMPFLEVAIAGSADALVTGNLKHFKPVRARHTVSVLSPVEFLRLI